MLVLTLQSGFLLMSTSTTSTIPTASHWPWELWVCAQTEPNHLAHPSCLLLPLLAPHLWHWAYMLLATWLATSPLRLKHQHNLQPSTTGYLPLQIFGYEWVDIWMLWSFIPCCWDLSSHGSHWLSSWSLVLSLSQSALWPMNLMISWNQHKAMKATLSPHPMTCPPGPRNSHFMALIE